MTIYRKVTTISKRNLALIGGGVVLAILAALLMIYGVSPGARSPQSATTESTVVDQNADRLDIERSDQDLTESQTDTGTAHGSDLSTIDSSDTKAYKDSVPVRQELVQNFRTHSHINKIIDQIAERADLGYDEIMANKAMWLQACSTAEQYKHLAGKAYELKRITPKILNAINLVNVCDGIPELSVELKELAITQFHEYKSGDKSSSSALSGNISSDTDPTEAAHWIRDALHDLNEVEVIRGVTIFAYSKSISPPIPEEGIESRHLYSLPIINNVASALMCDSMGGCKGDHPIVLRQCLSVQNRICYKPRDFFHAMEQVLTGMEQRAFWALYQQIRSRLS